ncbi:MAG: DUF3014 domain-containing protein, partial [Burkholderiaceae bacterium]|nr:DUF3014 domain-containing protein [Burkholderiaceae bacterium]
LALALAIGAAVYLYDRYARRAAPVARQAPEQQAAAPPPAPATPVIKHPIEDVPLAPAPGPELPPREQSDSALREALESSAPKELSAYLVSEELVRRFVATVDNLPRQTLPMKVRAARATPERFATSGPDDQRVIAPENTRRYEPFARLVETVDARALIAIYLRFYPLLQQEYRALGFPDKHFNDRVVEAIDDLLSAPEPQGPIALVQPKVMYRFADPALESLSAGRKIMIRIGPENARRMKAKLREIRATLAGKRPAGESAPPAEKPAGGARGG